MASNLRVDSIVPATGRNVSIGTATGGVNIPGVLTYEDVTNVDSVGVITARSGIRIGATGANTLISGTATGIGIGEDSPDSLLHIGKGTNADDGAVVLTIGGSSVNTRQSTITKNNVGSNDRALEIRAATGGSDETIKFFSDATTERLRIASSGQIGLGGANYGTSGQVLTSQGSGSAVQWASPTPAAGSVVQTLSFFGAEETVGAQITTNKINDTFTPLYTGSKFAVWLTVPNITGQSGAYNTFTVYLGTSSTPQSNTQVIKVGQRTFGTSGQDDLMCLSSADYGNFTNSGTGTHYASLRVTSGQYPVTIARHSDGTDSMKVKLILQEIKQ